MLPDLTHAQSLFGSRRGFSPYSPPNLTGLRVTMILLSGAAGFALGWLISPQAAAFRRNCAYAVLGILMITALANNGGLGWSAALLLSVLLFAAGIGYGLACLTKALLTMPNTFGTAKWADAHELAEAGLIGEAGIRLGVFDEDGETLPLCYAGDRHLLSCAPTRAGKGTTAIIPNLLTYEGSMLVIDPKGENALITAAHRQAMGQEVHIVDPWGIAADTGLPVSRFNPLDWLQAGDVDITENAMLLSDAMVVKGSMESFWLEESKALIQGLNLYVATDPNEAGQRHLGRVRDLLLLDAEEMPKLFERMTESPHHIVASTGARCLQKDPKLLSNVMASAQAQTHFLDSARLRENLSVSDFTFESLKEKHVTIYLVLPADRMDAFGRWLRLLIQQAITVNARNIADKPDLPVLFILDEMPALGHLTMIEQAYALMAGFGFQLWGICQDFAQLKAIYGDRWETFVGNSGVLQSFGARDRFSTDYLSALCGMSTVWNISTAISHAITSSVQGSTSKTSSENRALSQRPLIYADELLRLGSDKQLLLIENRNPVMGRKVRWFDDPDLKGRGRNLQAESAKQEASSAKNTEANHV